MPSNAPVRAKPTRRSSATAAKAPTAKATKPASVAGRAGASASKADPRVDLGNRIRELREIHQVTQEELADRSGLFRTYLSRVEAGLANPTLTGLHQLARGLGVAVVELLVPPGRTGAVRVQSLQPASRGRVSVR